LAVELRGASFGDFCQSAVDFVEGCGVGHVEAVFQAADGFDADAGQAGQLGLGDAGGFASGGDLVGKRDAHVLKRIGSIGQGRRELGSRLGVCVRAAGEFLPLLARDEDVIAAVHRYVAYSHLWPLSLFIVESIAVTDFFNNHGILLEIELHTIIAGAQAVASDERAPERFGAADARPLLEALEQLQDTPVDGHREPLNCAKRFRQDPDRHDIILITRQRMSSLA